MKRILITGVTGMLGHKVADLLHKQSDVEIFGLARSSVHFKPGINYLKVDLTDNNSLDKILNDIKPEAIIHCAANTNIADCEKNKDDAYELHVNATEQLAQYSSVNRFIYISTDSVFDGSKGNYNETENIHTINYYAFTKHLGEEKALLNNENTIVLRTNLYGFNDPLRSSLVEWAIKNLTEGIPVKGFTDVFFNPLYTVQAANVILNCLDNNMKAVLHIGCKEHISKYEFLVNLAYCLNIDSNLIIPASIKSIEALKDRPLNTTLNTSIFEQLYKSPVHLKDGIRQLVGDYKTYKNEQL